jgi:hypothetical protein
VAASIAPKEAHAVYDLDISHDLRRATEVVARLAGDDQRSRAALDAFQSADRRSFQRLLGELGLTDQCELACDWLRTRASVLTCLELCGPPLEELPDLREFAEITVRVATEYSLVEPLVGAVARRDPSAFRGLVAQLHMSSFSHLLCHWVCGIRSRRTCTVLCAPVSPQGLSIVEELAWAGSGLRTLLKDEAAFVAAAEATRLGECERLHQVLAKTGLVDRCELICDWFCGWRSVWLDRQLCRGFPMKPAETGQDVGHEFATAFARLAAEPERLGRLGKSVVAVDEQAFCAEVEEVGLQRVGLQLCHWVCGWIREAFSECVCADAQRQAWLS